MRYSIIFTLLFVTRDSGVISILRACDVHVELQNFADFFLYGRLFLDIQPPLFGFQLCVGSFDFMFIILSV